MVDSKDNKKEKGDSHQPRDVLNNLGSGVAADSLMSDGFLVPELELTEGSHGGKPQEPPPAYGDSHDQLQFSQPGFEAGAAITDAGRVNININTKNRRLADLLAPVIENQIQPDAPTTLPPAYIPPSLGGQPGQKPPSRLNVVVQIVGSRGDVQPFIALGKVLKDTYGHRVRIATHGTFQKFVEENDLEFFNIGGDPAELMAFMVKHPGLMPGFDAIKSGEITKRRKGISEMLLGCWRSCFESGDGFGPAPPANSEVMDLSNHLPHDDGRDPFVADAIIANPPSFAHIHVAEKLGIPLHMMFTMPWTPTRAFPHPLADIQSSNADDVMTKYLTYTLLEMLTWQGLGDVINRFREKALDLPPLSMIWAPGLLNRLKIPYTYCWSPSLIPKPNDWGNYVDISGFYFLDLATSYTPDPELAEFLASGPPPVYIGFGSIVVDDPNSMTRMIFDAVRYSGVRALVSKGWGGLGADQLGVPENVFMLGNVPHDWLFQRVSCVVHHGGAGTTAAGIKAGKPTLVVPFFGDQPFWGAMIARAKAGPDPIPYKKLNAEKLSAAINFCLKEDTVEQAKLYGEKIREEKGTDVGGQCFHNHLDIDSLRCSVAPSRTAVWRVRRSNVRLSPLAATVLTDKGLLKYGDLKLYRPREYNTDDQPPDPISAAASSLIMDASGIGMAIADMPRQMFKGPKRSTSEAADDQPLSPEPAGATTASSSKEDVSRTAPSEGNQDTKSARDTESTMTTLNQSNTSHKSLADSASAVTSDTAVSNNPEPERLKSPDGQESSRRRSQSPAEAGIEVAMGAGKGVGRVVGTGVKSPMNFCLGLAKGFRNMPRLYNDDTVRPVEKVTDISSGLRVAGKELGFGLYDGISGLVTQPLRGAEKEGAAGLIKGFGKGIGGIVAKPAAGFWGVPGYAMKGLHAQVTRIFTKTNENYIITSRIIQGQRDMSSSTREERDDIVTRWNNGTFDLKAFDRYRREEKAAMKAPASADTQGEPSTESQRPSWLRTRLSSFDNKLRDGKARYQERKDSRTLGSSTEQAGGNSSGQPTVGEDPEFEKAIQASVKETSRGNAEEDAAIEAAIRQSVNAMREEGDDLPDPAPRRSEKDPSIFEDSAYRITDEEYQDLIEQAMRDSMGGQGGYDHQTQDSGVLELDAKRQLAQPEANVAQSSYTNDDDESMRRVMEESKKTSQQPAESSTEDDELRRALAASKEEAEKEKNERTEEDVVLEYIKKQSLKEEEYRKQADKGKGKVQGTEVEEEDLKRAMEESLKLSRPDGSGASGAGGSGA